jgi:hypothetical protein
MTRKRCAERAGEAGKGYPFKTKTTLGNYLPLDSNSCKYGVVGVNVIGNKPLTKLGKQRVVVDPQIYKTLEINK